MIAAAALLVPPLLLLLVRESVLKRHDSISARVLSGILAVVLLNGTMFLLLRILRQYGPGALLVKLNGATLFPLKYMLLSLALAAAWTAGEWLLRKRAVPAADAPRRAGNFLRLPTAALYVVFVLLMAVTLSQKENFHEDEMYTYGLSNNVGSLQMIFEDGVAYDPAEIFGAYLTVSPSSGFDYGNVWTNQANDVHPPLYYAVVHTVCSLFPETFSLWFAGIVNIAFAVLTLFFLRKLCLCLTGSGVIRAAVSIGFVLSSGVMNSVSFLRMYVMAMFWVTVTAYLILRAMEREDKLFYPCIFSVTVLGALTHYYCIVFAVLISVSYGLYLLVRKKWRQAALFSVTQALAGAVSYRIFPAMVKHMFFGYRGTESLDNLSNMGDYWERLKSFYTFLDHQMFGGCLGYFLCGMAAWAVVCRLVTPERAEGAGEGQAGQGGREAGAKYAVLFPPLVLYFFLVSKMATFLKDRYLFPIYALAFACVLCLLFTVVERSFGKRTFAAAVSITLALTVIGSWKYTPWSYLYKESLPLLETAEAYSDRDCLCVYNAKSKWAIAPMYYEALHYNSITFLNSGELERVDGLEAAGGDSLLLTVVRLDAPEDYVREVLARCPQYVGYEQLGSYLYSTTYLLYGADPVS